MVLHVPQVAVTSDVIAMSLQKEVFRKLKDNRKKHKQLACDVVVDLPREGFDLGAVFIDDCRVCPLQLRNKLWDIVDLRVVEDAWTNLPKTKRFVAVVSTVFKVCTILELLLHRQLENLLADRKLFVDLLLCQTEVDDVEEPFVGVSNYTCPC